MDKLGLFFVTCLVMIPVVFLQGIVGYWLLEDTFHIGYGAWVGISVFANMYAPFTALTKS